jgi:hypothetical protein
MLFPYRDSGRPPLSVLQEDAPGEVKLTVRSGEAFEDVLALKLDANISSSTFSISADKIGTFTRTSDGNVTESYTWTAQR